MNIIPSIAQLTGEMTAWRRHLHTIPELGFEEVETSRFVAEKLRSFGIDVVENIGRTGVVGTLRGRLGEGRSIGIRADMDALPMTEARPLPHASRVAGRMHACGHDGHTSALLGAAAALARSPQFAGTVHFIFQPAEEGLGGALAMLDDGLFERFPCDEIYAYHNSERPLGQIAVYDGVVAAAADRFTITVRGRGGHAAAPHLTRDPIPVAARILLSIEALPARHINVSTPAIVTVGAVHAGQAFNAIPDAATLIGTVRCFSEDVRAELEASIRRIAEAEAAAHGATVEIVQETLFSTTVNSVEHAEIIARLAGDLTGQENIVRNPPPELGSEDFSFMLQKRPGCYVLIGQSDAEHAAAVHDPNFDFNDRILPLAASLWVRVVEERLGTEAAD
jgi:amidohydrolase